MPVLSKVVKTKTITLPVSEAKVDVKDKVVFSEIERISKIENDSERGIETILSMIVSWNFVDENNKPLEINKENLGYLDNRDVRYIDHYCQDLVVMPLPKTE